MIVLTLTFVFGGLLARWLSLTLPRGRRFTLLAIIAGVIAGPFIGSIFGAFAAFSLQNSPEYNANHLLGTGLISGTLWSFVHPLATWYFRHQRARVGDGRSA